jgi:hypothetical protein
VFAFWRNARYDASSAMLTSSGEAIDDRRLGLLTAEGSSKSGPFPFCIHRIENLYYYRATHYREDNNVFTFNSFQIKDRFPSTTELYPILSTNNSQTKLNCHNPKRTTSTQTSDAKRTRPTLIKFFH